MNVMEYFQKDSIKLFNVRKIEIKDNYFGFPIGLPVALVCFQSSGSNCPEPLPFSTVSGISVSGNTAGEYTCTVHRTGFYLWEHGS